MTPDSKSEGISEGIDTPKYHDANLQNHLILVSLFYTGAAFSYFYGSVELKSQLLALLMAMTPLLVITLLLERLHLPKITIYGAQSGAIIFLLQQGFLRTSLPLIGELSLPVNFFIQFIWAIVTINILRLFRVFSILPHIFIFSMSLFLLLLSHFTGDFIALYPLLFFLFAGSLFSSLKEIRSPSKERRPEFLLAFYGISFLAILLTIKIKGTGVLLFSIPLLFLIHPILFICYLLISSYIVSGLYRKKKRSFIRHHWRVTSKNIALFFLYLNFNIQLMVFLRHLHFSLLNTIIICFLTLLPLLNFGYRMFLSTPSHDDQTAATEWIKILGLTIINISRSKLLLQIKERLQARKKTFIVTPDTLAILRSQSDETYYDSIKHAEYKIADGVGVMWASNMVGNPVIERLPGVEIFEEICAIANNCNKTVYLLGAQKRVVEDAAFNLVQNHPGLKIAGFHDGFFTEESKEEEAVLEDIRNLKPDIVFVAMGVPRQENWIARHRHELPVTLFMGIGGSFDVLAGRLRRAPMLIQNIGLEWLYRLYLQPSRIKKIIQIPLFIFKIIEFNLESSTSQRS